MTIILLILFALYNITKLLNIYYKHKNRQQRYIRTRNSYKKTTTPRTPKPSNINYYTINQHNYYPNNMKRTN